MCLSRQRLQSGGGWVRGPHPCHPRDDNWVQSMQVWTPAGHQTGCMELGGHQRPGRHSRQLCAPSSGWNLPAEHASHSDMPNDALALPGGHLRGSVLPAKHACPGGQTRQSERSVAPVVLLHVPPGQTYERCNIINNHSDLAPDAAAIWSHQTPHKQQAAEPLAMDNTPGHSFMGIRPWAFIHYWAFNARAFLH